MLTRWNHTRIIQEPHKHDRRKHFRRLNSLIAEFSDTDHLQQEIDLIVMSLPGESRLRRQCEYKYAWVLREAQDAIVEYTSATQPDWNLFDDIENRLCICRQTIQDIREAANGRSLRIFDAYHPLHSTTPDSLASFITASTTLSILHMKLDNMRRMMKMSDRQPDIADLVERYDKCVNAVHDLSDMDVCRDPKELLAEVAQLFQEYDAIRNALPR